ncbi:MAG: FimV/HubP family polar landmark protein, partial [Stenotrophobium sp.]
MTLITFAALLAALAAQAAGERYGPVKANESLSSIAYRLRPDQTRTGTYQAMTAIYRANPAAFEHGDPGRIKPGSLLNIPSAEEIRAVDARQALDFYAHRTEQPTRSHETGHRRSDKKLSNTKNSNQYKTVLPRQTARAGEPAPDLREVPGAPRAFREAEPAPLPDPNRYSGLQPVPPPAAAWQPQDRDKVPVPDRWRLLDTLGLMHQRWYDPYNQNTLKGDKPLWGNDKFFILSLISDSIYEPRRLPTAVGPQGSSAGGSLGVFGGGTQSLFSQSLILSTVYVQGDTTFRPPDVEYHFTPVFNFNRTATDEARTLDINPDSGRTRSDSFLGVQELFADYHLRNVSARYDFDSVRLGVQPFSSDFRGFLFQDNQLALRLFGNRDNNRWQYNLAWIRRLEKDTNSGLNDLGRRPRDDDTFVANLYRQDLPVPGFTSQVIVAHNRNREDGHQFYDSNGFIERPASFGNALPHRYQVTYLGYNGDGHFGRVNLTASAYFLTGNESHGAFNDASRHLRAGFGAAELSVDTDWARWRLS